MNQKKSLTAAITGAPNIPALFTALVLQAPSLRADGLIERQDGKRSQAAFARGSREKLVNHLRLCGIQVFRAEDAPSNRLGERLPGHPRGAARPLPSGSHS